MKISKSESEKTINLLFGPPSDRGEDTSTMAHFFTEDGVHVICGGTTAQIAARYLNAPIQVELDFVCDGPPNVAHIEGVDLVTEGIFTVTAALERLRAGVCDPDGSDGVSLLVRMLLQSDFIRLCVGGATNSANPNGAETKKALAQELAERLTQMNKTVELRYI